MSINASSNKIEKGFFRYRLLVLVFFAVASIFLLFQASNIKLESSFYKHIPLKHDYIKTYLNHQDSLNSVNIVLISVCQTDGDIFNKHFFSTLKNIHDKLFIIASVDQKQVKSLYSPNLSFVDINNNSLLAKPVIPVDLELNNAGLATVKRNVEQADIVGDLVANDYSCTMIKAALLDNNPDTGEKTNTLEFARQLEQDIRSPFEKGNISIHIIGFAKMMGDIAEGAKEAIVFLAIAIIIISIMVYFFCHSLSLTILTILSSLIAVVWQIGMLSYLGFGLEPLSILLPFIIFSIGVSHGVLLIDAVVKKVNSGASTLNAVQGSFANLIIPGTIALFANAVGFITLALIDIGTMRELAISASLGVAILMLTNFILLPVLISYVNLTVTTPSKNNKANSVVWLFLANIATKNTAKLMLLIIVMLYGVALYQLQNIKLGELPQSASLLSKESRFNQDTVIIADKYDQNSDYMVVVVETTENACLNNSIMDTINRFQWRMEGVEGVQAAMSLSSIAKNTNADAHEGNLKWRVIPRDKQSLAQSIAHVPAASALRNHDCSVMSVILFLENHSAQTITKVVKNTKLVAQELSNEHIVFKLASGSVVVMAATNEVVARALLPMTLYFYGAVVVLCLISFRSIKAAVIVALPLYIVSTLAQGVMFALGIGLTVTTLPFIILGVGVGINSGLYMVAAMREKLRAGDSIAQAYVFALNERGSAILLTSTALSISVLVWSFSDFKFQADMGLLLSFMFLANMFAAIVILPALSAFLWKNNKSQNI